MFIPEKLYRIFYQIFNFFNVHVENKLLPGCNRLSFFKHNIVFVKRLTKCIGIGHSCCINKTVFFVFWKDCRILFFKGKFKVFLVQCIDVSRLILRVFNKRFNNIFVKIITFTQKLNFY